MSAPSSIAQSSDLLTTREAAELVRLSAATLERLRGTGGGPAYLKCGAGKRAKVLYRRADIDAWLDQRLYHSTSDYPAAPG